MIMLNNTEYPTIDGSEQFSKQELLEMVSEQTISNDECVDCGGEHLSDDCQEF